MKRKIDKLKYPLWFNIAFYILTIVAPLAYVLIEGYKAPNQFFRLTFAIIVGLLILWLFINKFLLKDKFDTIKSKKLQLEHEYQIKVGDADNIRQLWFNNEIAYNLINAINVLIYGLLIIVIAYGISLGCLKVKAITIYITICYVLAFLLKFLVLTLILNNRMEQDNG